MFEVPIRFRFYEKLKLYNDFVSKKSIFQGKLWDECQVVLVWSASSKHKHIGTYLDTGRICEIFGIKKELFKNCFIDLDKTKDEKLRRLQSKSLNKPHYEESELKDLFPEHFSKEIISKTVDNKLKEVLPTMKNLHVMGFGDLDETGEKIRINSKGFMMGELLIEIQKSRWNRWKYVGVLWFLKVFIGILIVYSTVFMLSYLWDFLNSLFWWVCEALK